MKALNTLFVAVALMSGTFLSANANDKAPATRAACCAMPCCAHCCVSGCYSACKGCCPAPCCPSCK